MPDLTSAREGWYCFKALPKKEHIAATLLSRVDGIEAICPRISYLKKTRRGKVKFIECLFPGYVFVRADLVDSYRIIRSVQGIRDVVAFGDRIPRLTDAFMEDLKAQFSEQSEKELPKPVIEAGQDVVITEGPFKDIQAVVTGEMDAHQRVAILLEFLGRQMQISIPAADLEPHQRSPRNEAWET